MHHMVCRVACGPGRAGKTAPEQTMSKHFAANEPWLHDKTYGLVVCNITGQFATSLSLIIFITCVYLYIILFMRQKCMVTRRDSRALPEKKQVEPSFFFLQRDRTRPRPLSDAKKCAEQSRCGARQRKSQILFFGWCCIRQSVRRTGSNLITLHSTINTLELRYV